VVDVMFNDCHFMVTDTGGFAVQLVNETGAPSIRGTLVRAGTTNYSFTSTIANDDKTIGVVRQENVPSGQPCWVLVYGIAEVLLENGTTSTAGYWCRTSKTASGRAIMNLVEPPGGGSGALKNRTYGIGHCIETKPAGTNVFAKCVIRFG
jgi:hypothetical protein